MRFIRYSPSKTDDVTQELVSSPTSDASELQAEASNFSIYLTCRSGEIILRRTIGLMGKSGSSGRFIMAGGLLVICSYLQYQFYQERRNKV